MGGMGNSLCSVLPRVSNDFSFFPQPLESTTADDHINTNKEARELTRLDNYPEFLHFLGFFCRSRSGS